VNMRHVARKFRDLRAKAACIRAAMTLAWDRLRTAGLTAEDKARIRATEAELRALHARVDRTLAAINKAVADQAVADRDRERQAKRRP